MIESRSVNVKTPVYNRQSMYQGNGPFVPLTANVSVLWSPSVYD